MERRNLMNASTLCRTVSIKNYDQVSGELFISIVATKSICTYFYFSSFTFYFQSIKFLSLYQSITKWYKTYCYTLVIFYSWIYLIGIKKINAIIIAK